MEALGNANIDLREDFVIHNAYAHNSIERAFSYWQSLPANESPTAVVAVSDFVAIAAHRIAEQCGYQLGETMSIAGFDDAPFVRYNTLQLLPRLYPPNKPHNNHFCGPSM